MRQKQIPPSQQSNRRYSLSQPWSGRRTSLPHPWWELNLPPPKNGVSAIYIPPNLEVVVIVPSQPWCGSLHPSLASAAHMPIFPSPMCRAGITTLPRTAAVEDISTSSWTGCWLTLAKAQIPRTLPSVKFTKNINWIEKMTEFPTCLLSWLQTVDHCTKTFGTKFSGIIYGGRNDIYDLNHMKSDRSHRKIVKIS